MRLSNVASGQSRSMAVAAMMRSIGSVWNPVSPSSTEDMNISAVGCTSMRPRASNRCRASRVDQEDDTLFMGSRRACSNSQNVTDDTAAEPSLMVASNASSFSASSFAVFREAIQIRTWVSRRITSGLGSKQPSSGRRRTAPTPPRYTGNTPGRPSAPAIPGRIPESPAVSRLWE